MKKYFFLFLIVISHLSCTSDDNYTQYEILAIDNIDLPESFSLNETYTINYTFKRPTSCHAFYETLLQSFEENRSLAVSSVVLPNNNCIDLSEDNASFQSFEFKVLYDQTYKFNIWKGRNTSGEDVYETIEVPVE